ncbi:MAG: PASTA domain-containing protein [Erysipelotrichaceae bacterium]|jgi:beta-lactam-binding protein with PASTA domain|nr:PASTA domain-containing protein [Erysipelotrichaceae bacterium]
MILTILEKLDWRKLLIVLMAEVILVALLMIPLVNRRNQLLMPDFFNTSLVEVEQWAKQNSLTVEWQYAPNETIHQDYVVSQNVRPGSVITSETQIIFVISQGGQTAAAASGISTRIEGETYPVKELEGKTEIEVRNWLNDNEIKVLIQKSYIYNDSIPQGQVVTAVADAPDLSQATQLDVTFSNGKPELKSHVGQQLSVLNSEVNALNAEGAKLVLNISYQYSTTAPSGQIMSQEKTGSLEVGTTINVIVSSGPDDSKVTLVNYENKSLSELSAWAQSQGLSIKEGGYSYSSVAKDTILTQEPKSGTLDKNGVITYTISKGLFVPETYSGTLESVKAKIEDANAHGAGWTLKTVEANSSEISAGSVIPAMQTIDNTNKTITVVVSKGAPTVAANPVPNYVDFTTKTVTMQGYALEMICGPCTLSDHSGCATSSSDGGVIYKQSPAAGTDLALGSKVIIYVKMGQKLPDYPAQYPNATANPKDAIASDLAARGFTNVTITNIGNGANKYYTIISVKDSAGNTLQAGLEYPLDQSIVITIGK